MNRVRGQIILVVTDTLLAYSLEMLKLHTNVMVNNEFALNFANHFDIHYLYLCGTALLTLVAAGVADSLSCKFYPCVVGLVGGLISLICAVVQLWLDSSSNFLNALLNMSSKVFLLVYVSTSAIRDMFIIEQIKFPNPYEVHRYIFLLVYPRTIVRGVSRIAFERMDAFALKINLTVLLVVYLAYFIFFTFGLVACFYIESIYYNIWSHGLMCFFHSFKIKRSSMSRSERSFDSSFKSMTKPSIETYNINIHEPKITRQFLGFRAIIEHPSSLDSVEKVPEAPNQIKESNKTLHFWFAKLVAPEKKDEVVVEPPQDVKDEMIYKKHWLHKSSPKSTEYVIIQTSRFFDALNFIIAGCFFSWLDYFLSAITYLQTFISRRNMDSIFDSIDPPHIAFGFDLVLFPIFYFLLFPLLSQIFRRDVRFFHLGYLFVLVANIVMLCTQAKAVVGQRYLPGPTSGQLRIYNGLDTTISVSPLWDTSTFQIPSHGEHVIVDIHLNSNSSDRYLEIKNEISNMTIISNATIFEGATACYVVTISRDKKRLLFVQLKDRDVTAFGKHYESLVTYVIVSSYNTNFSTIQVVFSEKRADNMGKTVYQRLSQPGAVHVIEPGEYNILIRYGDKNEFGYSLSRPVLMQKWGVYSLFFYLSSNSRSIEAQHFHLEGPPGTQYALLYLHLFIASLGRAFATVPFYMFLYLESPEKLRSTVISLVLFINLIWLAVFNSRFIVELNHGKHMTFMILFVFAHSVLFLLIYFTSKFRHRHSRY